jgi:hypothetical protein|nr:MAG TPA: hypothetical protein [Crassvirales sp.]
MIDVGILITGGIGLVTTVVSGWTSWFFARKKYNTEVDSNEIENLKKSLEFYESIVKDNNKKLQFYIDLAENNRIEVYRLKGVIHRLLNNSCLDNGCIKRKFYTEEQIREILGEVAPHTEEDKDETKA